MSQKILITGGTGLVGTKLKQTLQRNGDYDIYTLSRKQGDDHTYVWDVENQTMDPEALNGTEAIIHLAGAGVADEKWTEDRKKVLYDSRIESTKLLYNTLKSVPNQVKSVVCASAIGYYGFDRGNELLHEEDHPGEDFLAELTRAWENETIRFLELGIRTVQLRIGIVLSLDGGALPKIISPVRFMVGAPLGSGKQVMSWIHEADLASMIRFSMENENISGPFNAVAPNPVSNAVFTRTVAKRIHKPMFLPNVPAFVLKTVFGDLAVLVLGGLKVSSDKIEATGFNFRFPELDGALQELLYKKK